MPNRIHVQLDLNGPQFQAYNWIFGPDGKVFRRRTVFLPWGRGVGKSWFRRQIWWTLVAAFEGKLREHCPKPLYGVRITSLMPTLKQFRDVHWSDIETELKDDGPWAWLGAKLDKQTCQIDFPGGSWIKPFPASQYNARTSRGMRTDVLDSDEYDDIDADVYDSVAVPWLSEPWSLGIELPGGTPTRGRHGIWWRTLESARLGGRLRNGEEPPPDLPAESVEPIKTIYGAHATYRDAPETVSAEAVAKAKATTLEATFQREWEANADAGEGLVYPFDDNFHIRTPPELSTFREFHVGMDHGFVDPGVLLLCGVQGHGEDAILWALDEDYESGIANEVWNTRALKWKEAKYWPDPSRPDRVHDLRMLGINVGDVDNAIFAGIGRVADLMFKRHNEDGTSRARFYVSPKCVNLIRELGLYRRKKRTDGSFDEEPEDKNNHAPDALRYLAVGRFGRLPNYRTEIRG